MVVIKVPKTPKKAFDKNRQPNGLLRTQMEHLEAVVTGAPTAAPTRATRTRVRSLTEGGTANRVAELMRQLQAARAPQRGRVPEAAPAGRAAPKAATKARGAKKSGTTKTRAARKGPARKRKKTARTTR